MQHCHQRELQKVCTSTNHQLQRTQTAVTVEPSSKKHKAKDKISRIISMKHNKKDTVVSEA